MAALALLGASALGLPGASEARHAPAASPSPVAVGLDEVRSPTGPEHAPGPARAAGASRAPKGPRCATGRAAGGDWPLLNQGHRNARSQPAEHRIGATEAVDLTPAWTFQAESREIPGGMRSTPIVADGCVYVAFGQGYLGDRGDVVALNADTGEVVWHRQIDGSVLGLAAANGMIYATPSRGTRGDVEMPVVTADYKPAGSYAIALDARTGELRWTSERLDDGNPANGTFINASPVAFPAGGRDLLFVPLSGGSGDGARVPMYFLDARTGATVRQAYSLDDDEYAAGFGGTGIWSTAAYDHRTGHLYAGTADSDGHTRQHPYNNAILKIDADPRRATFATVVAAYSGTTEHADLDEFVGDGRNPACGTLQTTAGMDPPTFFDTSSAPECLELDLDFGGSPNLYEPAPGRLKVGALQKSGLFHSVDTRSMRADWTFFTGSGGAFNNSATAAVADGNVYLGATPNLLFALAQKDRAVRWASTTELDLFAYQPVTVANKVLYAINDSGFLLAYDARSGVPLLRRSIALDGAFDQCLGAGAGVSVARHTVFVPCDAGGPSDIGGIESSPGGLVAYRLPG